MDPASLTREVKVQLPTQYHLKLHSVKVLTGQPISATITAALDAYLGRDEVVRVLDRAAAIHGAPRTREG